MSPIRRATDRAFGALSIRNYRLFFVAQLVSVSGTWMQWVTQGWLVLRLGGGGVALGAVTALQFLPMVLGGLWGGALADRFDRRRILLVTQSVAALLAGALGALTATGHIRLWMVAVLSLLVGCLQVLDVPARHAFVGEMVGADRLSNAVGLNSAVFNAGRVVGPAVAAALIASVGMAPAFVLNGVSYVVVVGALLAMDVNALHREPPARGAARIREGLRYVAGTPELLRSLVLVGLVTTFGFNFTVLLPLLTTRTFHGDATTYGALTSIMALGSLAGALAAATNRRPARTPLLVLAASFGATTIAASFAPSVPYAAALLVLVGGTGIAMLATANSIFQLRTPPFMRGRVMALYSLVFLGGNAVGGPVSGWLAQAASPRIALAAGGVVALVAALAQVLVRRRSSTSLMPAVAAEPQVRAS